MFQNYVTSLFQWSEAELLDFGYYLLRIREILLTLYAKILQSFGIENLTISKAVLVSIFGDVLVHRDCYLHTKNCVYALALAYASQR